MNSVRISHGIPGNPNRTIISEPGVWRLVMRSTLPSAEAFQDWLAEEVLPSIRKTGKYALPAPPAGPVVNLLSGAAREQALEISILLRRIRELESPFGPEGWIKIKKLETPEERISSVTRYIQRNYCLSAPLGTWFWRPTKLIHMHYVDCCTALMEDWVKTPGVFGNYLDKSKYAFRATPVRPEDLRDYAENGYRATGFRMPPLIAQKDRYTDHLYFPDYIKQYQKEIGR